MAANVFRNPMKFFDATPTGRILSRFSGDVEVVDTLSQQLSDTVYCFMDVRVILFYCIFLRLEYWFINCFVKNVYLLKHQ